MPASGGLGSVLAPIPLDKSARLLDNNNMASSIDTTDDFKPGHTTVKVMRKEINEKTGKETIREVHRGIVVSRTNSFVRVFNPAPLNKGGDLSPETSETFPVLSRCVWCEVTGNRKNGNSFPIPPTLR
jgi:hypothetical protein